MTAPSETVTSLVASLSPLKIRYTVNDQWPAAGKAASFNAAKLARAMMTSPDLGRNMQMVSAGQRADWG
ncbi:hypothetical protein [Albidovulum aquaemixtae]|uniref:hypothetical protein n=1 Tax=Albidovulum aquaemixtae TaxID=1542388 RepID=UPI001C62A0D6|nr:hypothetical protein [Defluviimonas aquaemixtae]